MQPVHTALFELALYTASFFSTGSVKQAYALLFGPPFHQRLCLQQSPYIKEVDFLLCAGEFCIYTHNFLGNPALKRIPELTCWDECLLPPEFVLARNLL
jgi:hypothetical protein